MEEETKKLLTIVIPCYNSEAYLDRAVKSTLIGLQGIEVIIVDDGSTDSTPAKADRYAAENPDIIRVIHKENGGHGDAVMTGLHAATGKYFKVLDSDDWLGKKALAAVLSFILANDEVNQEFDMIISDYVYEKVGMHKKKRINYKSAMPVRTSFSWDDVKHFLPWQNILMHSVIYRTQILRDCKLTMPKHTFYVDNIYVYHPLPYIHRMYYLNVDLYHYYIGRDDQSVAEKNMLKRIDQQLLVTRILIEDHPLRSIENKRLRKYMSKYLAIMMTVSTAFLLKDGSEEAMKKRDDLWHFLKKEHRHQYRYVQKIFLGRAMQMKSRPGKAIILLGYTIAQKMFGFN